MERYLFMRRENGEVSVSKIDRSLPPTPDFSEHAKKIALAVCDILKDSRVKNVDITISDNSIPR